jgi:hypothetical protein
MSTACRPICKPDAPEWDETKETEQNERTMLVPVRRGHRIRERSSETRETYVALLITQRRLANFSARRYVARTRRKCRSGNWLAAHYEGHAARLHTR